MLEKIKLFFKGHERTVKAKKNIVVSLVIKGLSIVVGFLMIRITLDYLDQTKYGIWLTLTSFLTWFYFFEIGLGNGLKNRLAETLAVKDYKLARIYISTTYAILTIVISAVALVFFVANLFIDWTVILNTEKELLNELTYLAYIVFSFFFLNFVIRLVSTVLIADQRPAIANTFGPLGNLISLLIIYILTLVTDGSLIYLGWTLSAIPILILVGASIYYYKNDYKFLAPSLKFVNFSYAKDLLGLGIKFFVIQLSMIVIYQTSSIIIAQAFGPEEVVTYNIGYKYFSTITMIFTIIVNPFWAAYTEAWAKKEVDWIKKSIYNLTLIWGGISLFGFVMLLFSNQFYYLWLGGKIEIPFKISFIFLIYFITLNFGQIFVMFINGVGYVKVQMYSSILSSIVFILSSLIMIKYLNLGIESILIAMILSNFYNIIIAPLHYKKIINNRATGIWVQ